MRGVFIIMSTPYTSARAVDYEDLAGEVDYLTRCGVHGMVWPQVVSEYRQLTKEERLRGMEVLAKAAKGKGPALVLGIQGRDTAEALECARHAESLQPDAVIAIPPDAGKSLEEFRQYYRALARVTRRPFFIQIPAGGIDVTAEFILDLAREFPHFGYVKQEHAPVIERMRALAAHRSTMKGVFSGNGGIGMLYEMRLGFDGTMPGAPYADIYAQVWDLYQAGKREEARDLFGKVMLTANLFRQIIGTRAYIMKKRGVFKTAVSRQENVELTPDQAREVDFCFEALRPYLRVEPAGR